MARRFEKLNDREHRDRKARRHRREHTLKRLIDPENTPEAPTTFEYGKPQPACVGWKVIDSAVQCGKDPI